MPCYLVGEAAEVAFNTLLQASKTELPREVLENLQRQNVVFESPSPLRDTPCFPCPLRQQEACAAIRALEGCLTAAIADMRCGRRRREVVVDLERVTCYLMSAYITTLDGLDKGNPKILRRLPDTDTNDAQSILYRRLSAGLYETRIPGEYYHIHGSLEASTTLSMIGMPPFDPGMTDYRQCINAIENAVKQFSTEQLERLNREKRQSGCPVLTNQQYRLTPHGRAMSSLPPFTVQPLGPPSRPMPFLDAEDGFSNSKGKGPDQCLRGVRVLELCRIIAGPAIGRALAAHGASVLKVTSPHLPDVPFFQLDVNTGKHTTSLNLKDAADRRVFEFLLSTADVVIDGYRPGALARLGYSAEAIAARAAKNGRGVVYVAEDCFGGTGVAGAEWADRPGWQQIADCVTGVAWEQGRFMGLDEPVVPPFPMSDYGTGCLGAAAALTGLYRRATRGGSWICRTSLSQYNNFLFSLGPYPAEVQAHLRRTHDADFFALRHADSVDEVGHRAVRSIRRLHPALFADDDDDDDAEEDGYDVDGDGVGGNGGGGGISHRSTSTNMQHASCAGFGGEGGLSEVRWPREALRVEGLRVGHARPTRPNGFDAPTWDGWERDEALLARA
ncbi:CoA-transferase family III [Xylariaceae sp. FL0804]|nr:CoA-transferase family III [Xylariaceae sp. FL0804]